MLYNQNSGYGRALLDMVASQVPAFGNIFVVKSSSDSSDNNFQVLQDVVKNDSQGRVHLYASLSDAYDACQTNNNDVILLDAHSTHSLSSGIAWSKSRIHVIGMDGGNHLVQQGAKVELATAATTAYVLLVTGVRNTFTNVKFIQSATAGTGLTVVQMGGEGNVYKNCSFVFSVANNLGGTTAHEVVCGEDSGTFIDCTFGNDTLVTSAARSVLHIDQVTAGQPFKSNIFKNCNFVIASSDAGAQFVKMDAAGDVNFTNLFNDCTFQASICAAAGTAALTRAVSTANGLTAGSLNFAYPRAFGVTDFGTNGTNNDQLYVVAPLCVQTDIVGVLPIAT